MARDTEAPAWQRIRCAAILGGFRGPQELFAEVVKYFPDMTYSVARKTVTGRLAKRPRYELDDIADVVSQICALRGATVPRWWIVEGFDADGDADE